MTENPMTTIQTLARQYRQAKDLLTERAQELHYLIESAKRARLTGLRNAVAKVTEAEASLRAAIEAQPHLFVKPRSTVLEGVKLGYQKSKGKMSWDDDERVIRLIRKHLPDAADVLIKTNEKPVKDALSNLTAAELKKIGVNITEAGDEVFIKDTTATVDKLVAALLKGAEEEARTEV
ncbi:hypothetical protein ODD08_000303 [Salmonella enterica]|nr:hypothetical protein [Salmonella enterica]